MSEEEGEEKEEEIFPSTWDYKIRCCQHPSFVRLRTTDTNPGNSHFLCSNSVNVQELLKKGRLTFLFFSSKY